MFSATPFIGAKHFLESHYPHATRSKKPRLQQRVHSAQRDPNNPLEALAFVACRELLETCYLPTGQCAQIPLLPPCHLPMKPLRSNRVCSFPRCSSIAASGSERCSNHLSHMGYPTVTTSSSTRTYNSHMGVVNNTCHRVDPTPILVFGVDQNKLLNELKRNETLLMQAQAKVQLMIQQRGLSSVLPVAPNPSHEELTGRVPTAPPLIKLENEPVAVLPNESLGATTQMTTTKSTISRRKRGTGRAQSVNCIMEGCTKKGIGPTKLCKAHGGGRRCNFPGCPKSSQGATDRCKAHGGGKRCNVLNCIRSAVGRSNTCKAHGGGRRCQFDGCTKSAQAATERCIAHGGGRRCGIEGCTKSARGSTHCCIAHGGGRRCSVRSCNKAARGVTDKCAAHGGGKKCVVKGCGKSTADTMCSLCDLHQTCSGPPEAVLATHCQFPFCKVEATGGAMLCPAHGPAVYNYSHVNPQRG
jgi:hypothetical protein